MAKGCPRNGQPPRFGPSVENPRWTRNKQASWCLHLPAPALRRYFFPTRQEGVVRFYVGIRVCDASTPRPHPESRQSSSPVDNAKYPARAARQWIPPSPARAARLRGQGSSPVDPADYPARAARQWIPPSIPPELLASGSRPVSAERLASGSRRVSRQSGSPVDPAEYPAEYPLPVDPAEYPARAARQWIPPSIPLSIPCWWIVPSIRPASSRSGSQLFASGSRQCPQSSSPVWFCLMSRPAHSGAAFVWLGK